MSMSKGFDFLKVPPNSDLLHPRKLLDHSFTSQLPYSASFNDLDNKPVTLKKSSNPGRMDNVVANPMEDPNTNPKRNRLKQLSNAPKVSQRLPSPFSSTTHQRSSPIRRKNIFNKEINTEGELFGVIDNLVNINEFKNTKELLSPLKKRRVPKNDNEEDIEAEMKKKANGRKEKYPLVPLKNYLLLTKLNEVLHKSDDSFRQKIDKVYRTHQGGESFFKKPLQTENIKLNEMITLGTVKPSYGSGVVKKMLHAPTLKILCVKEVPINTRESRQALKVWLEEWQSSFYDSKHNLGVYDMFFNSPEGCLSIVSEYMSGGSIQTLLDSLVSIPEKALKKIGSQTLQALNEVHTRIKKAYGSLSPTQILLDRQGNIKLSLGLRSRISLSNGHHLTKGKSFAEKTLLAEPSPMSEHSSMVPKTLKPKAFNISPESKLHQQAEEDFSQDIFDFGYLMLLCAVGGLEFFDVNDFAGKLKILLAELDKKPQDKQKYCCLIHNEDLIWSVKLPHPEEDVFQKKPVKVHRNNNNNNNNNGVIFDKASSKSTPLISIKDFFVYNNFSKEFLEFLCCCLKFDSTKRSSIPALLSSPFLVKSHIKGPMTSLRELIKISHQWSNNNNLTLKPEHQGASENHLNKLCDALMVVLPNCQQFSAADDNPAKWDVLLKLGPGSQKIKELASELGLTPARVWDSISQVLQAFMEK